MEALVYIANGLYLASYFMQDILRLRALTITAACCLVAYFYLRPEPLMTVVCWNLFFVALNVVQIARLVRARRKAAPREHGRRGGHRRTAHRRRTSYPLRGGHSSASTAQRWWSRQRPPIFI